MRKTEHWVKRLRDNCSQDNSKTLETLNKNELNTLCAGFLLTRALMGSGELRVLMGGGVAQRAPLRIFKSKSRRDTPSKCVCTCEAALLGALRNRRLVGSLLPQKTAQFSRTSLSYRPIAALSTGVDRRPRSIRIFAQIRAELFAFLGLWHSAIKRSRVQILDLATQL